MKRDELVKFLNETLALKDFAGDVSNNGLQIEGNCEVNKVLFAVDGCQEVFEMAAQEKADFIFVHHGISWGSGMKYWVGSDARRFRTLFGNGISLYGAHLPLDANKLYGHNALLGDMIGLDVCLAIMDVLFNETHDPKSRASLLLRKMVRAGKLGRKTGEGFFKY